MKKIAIDMVNTVEPCGSKTFSITFCNNLIKSSFKLKNKYYIYIVKNYKKFLVKNNSKNIKFIIKPNKFSRNFYKFVWTQIILPYEIYKNKINTIYAPMNILPFVSRFFNVKKILSIHSNLPWTYFNLMPGSYLKKYIIKKIMEISINISDILIANSNYAKKEIKKKLNLRKKVFYVYLNLDIQKIKKKNIKKKYFLTILSCARYHNILTLLKAFKKIYQNKKVKERLIIIMQILDIKYYSKIKSFIKRNNLEKKIKIQRSTSRFQTLDILNNAKLYIFTSYSEVFGYTTIEAMSLGIPVMVAKKSALPEINSNAAIYFNPDSPRDIEKKFLDIYRSKSKSNYLIKNGYENIKRFKNDKTHSKLLEIIDN